MFSILKQLLLSLRLAGKLIELPNPCFRELSQIF